VSNQQIFGTFPGRPPQILMKFSQYVLQCITRHCAKFYFDTLITFFLAEF